MTDLFLNPLIKLKVGIFYHSCDHNKNPSGFNSCDPQEIAAKLKDLGARAVVIVGVYDEIHLKLYKEAALRAGINPLLVRVIDHSWGEMAVKENVTILENAWTADLALIEEKPLQVSRREVITGNLQKVKDRIDKPVYISEMCKGLHRACTVCQDSCSYKAITIDKKTGVIINYDKCTSCGLCASSCPMSAIEFPSVSQHSIFELAKVKGDKVISCYKDSGNSIKLPCIGMLSPEDIVLLRSNGKLTLKCPGCELSKNLLFLKSVVDDLNNEIGGISLITPEGVITMKEAKEVQLTFEFLTNRSEARKVILNSLGNISDIAYDVIIDQNKCTICESCIKWCPSSALTLERTIDSEKIVFDSKKCIGCNICVNVCPEGDGGCNGKIMAIVNSDSLPTSSSNSTKAIYIKRSKGVPSAKVVMEDYLVRCRVCGEPVGSRKSLNHVKKIMKERGLECEDEWLERCPRHRAEYSFQRRFASAKFKPKRFDLNVG
ncbi:4Fe-4S dicluster-binding protein [Sulfurisphaera ohwakuensis]|uniref:4Fe-4S dicluster domain-containing protein n=1 Tax=Sulfurisphaera ohwakuensis TaxID=69656 RepID=A0A650CGG1_SULOH|nr:4Fe-4S dicluster-binding protein [Sulfurisphaera ohwakuensis]MBB5252721.1 Pyruvate/2-oxoacid:ferredoxin oxidoreductase delta subunit [Sulfurisphaera ohwakuensis]QGR16859.1 4Fe-4S dicluster domain-containing protein [Sulfurisphaera ohwakuensis]